MNTECKNQFVSSNLETCTCTLSSNVQTLKPTCTQTQRARTRTLLFGCVFKPTNQMHQKPNHPLVKHTRKSLEVRVFLLEEEIIFMEQESKKDDITSYLSEPIHSINYRKQLNRRRQKCSYNLFVYVYSFDETVIEFIIDWGKRDRCLIR